MIKNSSFRQKKVYANRVLINNQNGKIYEMSSDMNKLLGIHHEGNICF